MAEDPPPQPRTRDDAGDKTPAQAVDEAVKDTPMPVSTKKAAELKFSGSVDASSSSTSLSIGTGHNHSTDGISSGLGQNRDNLDSREDTSDTIPITLSLQPDLGSIRAGEIYFRPLKLNPS